VEGPASRLGALVVALPLLLLATGATVAMLHPGFHAAPLEEGLEPSLSSRVVAWKGVLKMIASDPMAGTGLGPSVWPIRCSRPTEHRRMGTGAQRLPSGPGGERDCGLPPVPAGRGLPHPSLPASRPSDPLAPAGSGGPRGRAGPGDPSLPCTRGFQSSDSLQRSAVRPPWGILVRSRSVPVASPGDGGEREESGRIPRTPDGRAFAVASSHQFRILMHSQ